MSFTPILELKSLYKSFDGVKAVNDVSLSIESKTVTSIIGPNGAGKTTLFNLINGFLRQDAGSVHYKGAVIDNLSPAERALLGIGRLWQDIRLFKNMTVLENLLSARKNHPGEKILNQILRLKAIKREEAANKEAAERTLRFIDLWDKRNSLAKDLSYGQQKLLALGRLLMNDAELLLLDEPLAGVNPIMIERISDLVKELVAEGKTILMIEHNVPKAMAISDWVYVMDEGRIELSGIPAEVSRDPQLKEVYLGV